MCGVYPDADVKTAGEEFSSTYEGRHLTFLESELTHPSHTDGYVDKGDPVLMGENVVGVAFNGASAATDLVAIDTEGIWILNVVATNEDGNIAVAAGDELFIHKTTCVISKNPNKNTHARFGYALGTVASGADGDIAVKVHWNPDDATELVGVAGAAFTTALANTFREYRYQCSATSGASQGIYIRQYLTGEGTLTANSLRAYTDIVGVSISNAYGAHLSLGMGESTTGGAVTGLGVAVRATLGLPDVALAAGGTYAAIMPEIYAFGDASDPAAVTELSFIRCVDGGDATGRQAIDDKAYLLVIDGVAEGAGNMVVASNTEANYVSAARCKINGVEKWLMFASASG
jgi:hypothetical protein